MTVVGALNTLNKKKEKREYHFAADIGEKADQAQEKGIGVETENLLWLCVSSIIHKNKQDK